MKTYPFNFYPFEKEDILQYLEKKKHKGWQLLSVDFDAQQAKFIKNNKHDYTYDISIHKDYGNFYEKHNDDALEFIDSCQLSGWKHICTNKGVRFFYNEKDSNPLPLTDDEITYESIKEKKQEFRNLVSTKKTIMEVVFIIIALINGITFSFDTLDLFIIISSSLYLLIYAYVYFSKNIIFRMKGLYLFTWLIGLLFIIFFKFSYSLPLYLTIAFTLIFLIILFKCKHPFFLEIPYLFEVSFSMITVLLLLI